MSKTSINPRKEKLDAIITEIVMFLVNETYTGEQPAQNLLTEVIQKLDEAAAFWSSRTRSTQAPRSNHRAQ